MKKVKITVLKKTEHKDLIKEYELPQENACNMNIGDVYISKDANKPEGFCDSAWISIYPYVMTLASGGKNIFDSWMKNNTTAMVSCSDGFRPVSFYLEMLEN